MKSKHFVITGIILLFVGIVLFGIGLGLGAKFNFNITSKGIKFRGEEQIKKTENLNSFSNIKLDLSSYNVKLVKSDHYGIEYTYYDDSDKIYFNVDNDTLTIKQKEKNYFVIGFFSIFDTTDIIIYYNGEMDLVNLKIDSGNIKCDKLIANKINVDVDFGKISFSNINVKNNLDIKTNSSKINLNNINTKILDIDNDFGKIDINNLLTENLNIDADSSSININKISSNLTKINNDFGNVNISNFTSKNLDIDANSGKVDLQGTFIGNTKIDSDFGSVKINTTLKQNDYNYNIKTDFGNIYLDGEKQGELLKINNNSNNNIEAKIDSGNIKINFK